MFERTRRLVERLERKGTTPLRTRPLHQFIGEAVGTRNEVLSVLHLLDKPDAAWDDPAMDAIYDDLRDEFDLGDRFNALELKLRGVQEALELVLDVSRDRRLVLLEATIVVLIVLELALGLLKSPAEAPPRGAVALLDRLADARAAVLRGERLVGSTASTTRRRG